MRSRNFLECIPLYVKMQYTLQKVALRTHYTYARDSVVLRAIQEDQL